LEFLAGQNKKVKSDNCIERLVSFGLWLRREVRRSHVLLWAKNCGNDSFVHWFPSELGIHEVVKEAWARRLADLIPKPTDLTVKAPN